VLTVKDPGLPHHGWGVDTEGKPCRGDLPALKVPMAVVSMPPRTRKTGPTLQKHLGQAHLVKSGYHSWFQRRICRRV
jgi:hypothetical protein